MVAERAECAIVGRHGVVGEEAANDLPQPFPLFGDRLMHAPSQLLLDLLELRPHAVAPGLPLEQEVARAGFAADEGEAQEVEGLRFAEPALLARLSAARRPNSIRRVLSGCSDSAELPQPLAHRVPEAPGVALVLESRRRYRRHTAR